MWYYFYPAVGAVCLGMGVWADAVWGSGASRLKGWIDRLAIPLFVLAHLSAFAILAPGLVLVESAGVRAALYPGAAANVPKLCPVSAGSGLNGFHVFFTSRARHRYGQPDERCVTRQKRKDHSDIAIFECGITHREYEVRQQPRGDEKQP